MERKDQFLERLAAALTGLLNADPFFDFITVRDEQIGGVQELINATVDGTAYKGPSGNQKRGVAVIVHFPEIVGEDTESPAGSLFDIELRVTVYENTKANRTTGGTGLYRGQVAAAVIAAGKGFMSEYVGMNQPLTTQGRIMYGMPDPTSEIRLQVRFVTQWPLNFMQRVQDPTFTITPTDTGNEITLDCGTPWASIWYASSGFPSPINGALYTGPIEATNEAGASIRAVAYLPNMRPSNEIYVQIDSTNQDVVTDQGAQVQTQDGANVTTT